MPYRSLSPGFCRLNGQQYKLATDEQAGRNSKQIWRVESKRQSTKREPRPHVRPGDVPGRWIATYDDWSGGLGAELEPLPGKIHNLGGASGLGGGGLHGTVPGSLRPALGFGATGGVAQTLPTANPVVFNGDLFTFHGQYVIRYSSATSGITSTDKDFGSGYQIQKAVIHNNELVVAFGGSTNKIESRTAGGVWTAATNNTYADFFARVEDRLWRVTATNQVSNIGPTDNPLTLANWSSGITIGDAGIGCTDLNALGERVLVSKPNGLFPGDAGAVFENVLPQLQNAPDPDNGKNTLVRGSDVFFRHAQGVLRYSDGSVEEVGLQQHFQSASTADVTPGLDIRTMTVQGEYLWAMAGTSGFPRARATAIKKTSNGGSAYTTYLGTGGSERIILDSLDTVANGDWFVVGYSAVFNGVLIEYVLPNDNAATLTVEYWTGSAWSAVSQLHDLTAIPALTTPLVNGTKTLKRGGMILWNGASTSSQTIDGTSAFWYRFSVSAALDSNVRIEHLWVLSSTASPQGMLYRGRSRRSEDGRGPSIVWEPYSTYNAIFWATGMLYATDVYPWLKGGAVIITDYGSGLDVFVPVASDGLNETVPWFTSGMSCVMPRDDFGMPEVNKQFLAIRHKGRSIGAAPRSTRINYRVNQVTSWTTGTTMTSSPASDTLSGISGYSLQLQPENVSSGTTLVNASQSNEIYPEINEIEVEFEELPTYKNDYTALLDLNPDDVTPIDTQLTNLEALRGTQITLIDPFDRQETVIVREISEVEAYSTGGGYPAMLVEVHCAEV